jgi:hypothetical protein
MVIESGETWLERFSVIYKTLQLGVQKNMANLDRMRRGSSTRTTAPDSSKAAVKRGLTDRGLVATGNDFGTPDIA